MSTVDADGLVRRESSRSGGGNDNRVEAASSPASSWHRFLRP